MNAEYLIYALSRLAEKQKRATAKKPVREQESQNTEAPAVGFGAGESKEDMAMEETRMFEEDETGSSWHRESDIELLKMFCREGYAMAKRHGHFIVGRSEEKSYIGIPGRFMIEEQPAGGRTGFTLWQPLRGGEELYGDLEDISDEAAKTIYGYWIAGIDEATLNIFEV